MAEENIQTNAPEQDLSEILKVRREKLAALRAEGRDPFKETRFDVTTMLRTSRTTLTRLRAARSASRAVDEQTRHG